MALEQHCRTIKIEPPAPDRVERIIHAAVNAYDDRFCAGIFDRLLPPTRAWLDALLRPANQEGAIPATEDADGMSRAVILELRAAHGKVRACQ